MTKEETLNPSARYSMTKKTPKEELEERYESLREEYFKLVEARELDREEFGRMQTRMFYLSIILLIVGFIAGFLGRIILGG